jgi:hypothetical protein
LERFFALGHRVVARAMDGVFFATMSDPQRAAAITLKRSMRIPLAAYEEAFEREQVALNEVALAAGPSRPTSSFRSIGRSNQWVRPGLPDAAQPPRPLPTPRRTVASAPWCALKGCRQRARRHPC